MYLDLGSFSPRLAILDPSEQKQPTVLVSFEAGREE